MRMMRGMLLSALIVTGSAPSKTPDAPKWEIVPNKAAGACTAIGRAIGKVDFGLSSQGSDFVLGVWAPDFPKTNGSYKTMLGFDGHPPMGVPAQGTDGMMVISLGRGEIVAALVKASAMTISVDGHTHRLSLVGATAGLDAAARCAGQPTLSEAPERPPLPIPGGGRWTIYETLPAQTARACMAHLEGAEVDTMLDYDDRDRLVLTAGNRLWAFPRQEIPMKISLDGGADLPLAGVAEGHAVEMQVEDAGLVQQLRTTRILDWVFPGGSLRSDVTALGAALDAVDSCRKGKSLSKRG